MGEVKESDHLEDLDVDEIILKRVFQRWDGKGRLHCYEPVNYPTVDGLMSIR